MRGTTVICGMLAMSLALGLGACSQKKDEAAQGGAEATQGAVESAQDATSTADASFKTLGEVFAAETQDMVSTYGEGSYACAFRLNDQWMHVEAKLTEEQEKELDAVWTEDPEKAQKVLGPIEVTKCEALQAPAQAELDALVGKKGADLTKEGYVFSMPTVNGEQTDCVATKGDFEYLVTFKGKVADENTDDVAGAVADLPVESVVIQSVAWTVLDGGEG